MNTLFNNISWLRYAEWLAIAIIIYYVIVGFRCYRAEITNLLRRGSFKPAAADNPNPFLAIETDIEAIPETKNTGGIYQHLEGPNTMDVEAGSLIAGLRAQITEFSEQPYQPSAVPPKLKATMRKYRNLKNSSHRAVINQLVVAECEKTGIALLTEEEVDGRFAYREQPKVAPKEVEGEVKMVPTGETYFGWKGLNFKESDKNGNFLPKTVFWNHEKELVKYPVKELAEPYDHKRLLTSLEKGNKANATIIKDGQEIKGTIAANPRMQRFDFYDSNGQSLIVKQAEKQKVSQSEKEEHGKEQSQRQDNKQTQKADVAAEQKNNKVQSKKQGAHI